MLLGMHPVNLLLANTITEAGEFPKLSGMFEVNRLLFTKMASKSLSKSSGGNFPSNSLNLRSRYLRLGILRTTSGKEPTKWLLLMSNSYKTVKFEKVLGTIPQNLFELM